MVYGIIAVAIGLIAMFIYHFTKALKDPDVQMASNLRMPVDNFRLYERIYNEHWACMEKYGANSKEAEELFAKLFRQIKNPNEWRRYQEWRVQKLRRDMKN